jgi:hypothetical protein
MATPGNDSPEGSSEPVYRVIVDDNYHFMDEDARYEAGRYPTIEQAINECKRIVDEFLIADYKPGTSPEKLYSAYKMFGEDPWITAGNKTRVVLFSAWDYAERRCKELAEEEP